MSPEHDWDALIWLGCVLLIVALPGIAVAG